MNKYKIHHKGLLIQDIPFDSLTVQLQKQGLVVSLPHKSNVEGKEDNNFGEWQLCPKCNGGGRAMNMDNVVPTYLDTCDVCEGNKIIKRPELQSPSCSTLVAEEKKTDFQIACELSQTKDKPFFVDTFRKLLNQLDKGDISFSKIVEELNISAVKYASSLLTQRDAEVRELKKKMAALEENNKISDDARQYHINQLQSTNDLMGKILMERDGEIEQLKEDAAKEINNLWTDDLVKNYAESYRFSSSRISLKQFKETNRFNQDVINKNYELAIDEVNEQLRLQLLEKDKEIERLKQTIIDRKDIEGWWAEELKMNKELRELAEPTPQPLGEQDELWVDVFKYNYKEGIHDTLATHVKEYLKSKYYLTKK